MKNYNLLLYLTMIILFTLSCDDSVIGPGHEQEPEETTVEEDIENIESSMGESLDLMSELTNGPFISTLTTFLDAQGDEFSAEVWALEKLVELGDVFNIEFTEEYPRFDTEANKGIYDWDSEMETWNEEGPSDDFILRFPSSEDSQENDMVLTVSEYADVLTNVDGEQIYLPGRLQAELEQDEEVTFSLNLKEAQYADDNDEPFLPTVLDLEVNTSPYTFSWQLDRSSDTAFSTSFYISNENTLALGVELDLEVAHSDYSELDEGDIKNLSGKLKMTEDISINFEVGDMTSMDDVSFTNPLNAFVDLELFYKDDKVGDIEFSEESELMIIYQDESSEPLDQHYGDLLDNLQEILAYFYSPEDDDL
ncbi:MAG: hypothetical protein WD038_12800 [Balneolales bacterium]